MLGIRHVDGIPIKPGFCLEVGIVHPGHRKHWDDKKVIIPFMWDCWLDLFIIPVDPTMETSFLVFVSRLFFRRPAQEDGNRIVLVGLCSGT